MYYDQSRGEWLYDDNGELVRETWRNRPCGHCGEHTTPDGHDPCLGHLPWVLNACCGHGEISEAYIQFDDGRTVRGEKVLPFIRKKFESAGELSHIS